MNDKIKEYTTEKEIKTILSLLSGNAKRYILQLERYETEFRNKFFPDELEITKILTTRGFLFNFLYAKPGTITRTFDKSNLDCHIDLLLSLRNISNLIKILKDCTNVKVVKEESFLSNTIDFRFSTKVKKNTFDYTVRFFVDYGIVQYVDILDMNPEIPFTKIKDLSFMETLCCISDHIQSIVK